MPLVKEQIEVRSGNGALIVMTFDCIIQASNWMIAQKTRLKNNCPKYRLFRTVTSTQEIA